MGARYTVTLLLVLGMFSTPALAVEDEAAREFAAVALPLMQRYCLECHSTEEQEGDLDLERFTRLDLARNAPRVWQRVAEVMTRCRSGRRGSSSFR